jgi:hypothetical protein
MSQNNTQGIQVRIAMFGRSGVGKTSVITALWNEAKQLLADSPLKIVPYDTHTESLLHENLDRLQGSFFAGTFNHLALPRNVEEVQYALMLTTSGTTPVVQMWTGFLDEVFSIGQPAVLFSFKDYPGGWTDTKERERSEEFARKWNEYLTWIAASSVLIVPVNATLLMEGRANEDQARVPHLLGFSMLNEVVGAWASARVDSKLPGLLVFAPIRCESYFNDNRGTVDRSRELLEQFQRMYRGLLEDIKKRDERQQIQIEYHPIDTVGAVKVADVCWPTPSDPLDTLPEISYEVRPPGTYTPLGAKDFLTALSRHILKYWERERQLEWREYWDSKQGFFSTVVDLIFKPEDRDRLITMVGDWVTRYPAFKNTLNGLAARPDGKRVEVIRNGK